MKIAYLALALLALAACKPKETLDSQPLPPRADAPAAPTPAPSPNVLTPEGWGAIRTGMTEAQALEVLGDNVVPAAQPRDADWRACHMINPLSPEGVWIMVEEDKVTRVTVEDGPVRSDRGIAVGDPVAKVRAAYPQGLVETPHKYEDPPAAYLTWYARPGAAGVRYSINAEGLVGSISGGGSSIEYVEGCA